jgi:L-lactate dehydrogenase complex protein LldG
MTSSREQILAAVRRHQPAPVALPELPDFNADAPTTLEAFADALARLGGRLVMPEGTLADTLRACHPQARVIVSATPEVPGTRPLPDPARPGELDDVDVGVVRAAFGIAETGSVYLSETEFGVNALGFLPQHLVVLLDPAHILPGVQQAYRQPAFHAARYAALMTGPSATADIEGVLIRGAQGVRSLTVVPCAAP